MRVLSIENGLWFETENILRRNTKIVISQREIIIEYVALKVCHVDKPLSQTGPITQMIY